MSVGGGGAAREQMFPDGCTCTSYGHGLLMTRVTSYTCPIHAAEQPRVSGAEPPPAPSEADKQPESPLRAHQGEQVTASASLAAAVSAVPAQAAAAEAVVRMAISCAHPITGEEHDAVEAADAALDALLAQVNEAETNLAIMDENYNTVAQECARAEAEAERLRAIVRWYEGHHSMNAQEVAAALAGGDGT